AASPLWPQLRPRAWSRPSTLRRCVPRGASLIPQAQCGEERLLRDLHRADALHTALALLLFLEKLALSRDIAAIALCGDVLAQRFHVRARDDLGADCGLDRNVEHLAGNELLQFRGKLSAA